MPYKLGKKPARFPKELAKLRDRLVAPLPPPVLPFGYGLMDTYPMAENDTYGDCTIAGKVHCDEVVATVLQQPYTYPGDAAVLAGYCQLLGCTVQQLESDPQQYDTGLDLATVIQAWSAPGGFLGSQIVGAASIDKSDYELLQQALYSFGFLYVGVQLPTTAQTQFPGLWHNVSTGQPIEGGHCIVLNGAQTTVGLAPTHEGLNLITWGADIECTEAWWGNFGEEAWCVIPAAYEAAKHDALTSIDLTAMKADIAALQAAN
ncbi:MAG TPA: hypothetical protein VEH29_03205 [Acidimicrobiales bacterium]|nr:hypothetical protein [Acidimicrobiales bacterium]